MPSMTHSEETAIENLRDGLRGLLLRPGEPGYAEAATPWNGRFEAGAALVARCAGTADVMTAVGFAREQGVPLAVRSGGHDYAGNWAAEGAFLIDLSGMNAVRIDPRSRRAWVQPGATVGGFDHEAQAFGLATTTVTVSVVGVAGSTLGGGTGHLSRRHGLALDNLVSADLVTADGELVRASEEENPDLFWALRGGGGNFGVVTGLEFRLHEVGPQVMGMQIFHPFEAAHDLFRLHREVMADAPGELNCYPMVLRVPPEEPFPEEQHGKLTVALIGCWAGPVEDGTDALAPFTEFGDPFLSAVQPMPYTALQQSFDAGMAPKGKRWYTKAHYLDTLTDEAIDVFVEHASTMPGAFSTAYLEPLGGAIGEVAPSATAFPHRTADYGVHVFPGWSDPADDEEMMRWAREFHEALAPHATGGTYVNLLDGDEDDPQAAAYAGNLERLREVKGEWDPENVFRMNHNVEPAV